MIEISFLGFTMGIILAILLGMLFGGYIIYSDSKKELTTILLTSDNSDEVVKRVKDLL